MHAKDIMTTPAYTVHAEAPVSEAVALLERRSITAAPVVDEHDLLVGIVREVDLLRNQARAGAAADPSGQRVREVMSGLPVTAWPEADVADLADAMVRREAHTVPVVVEEHVVGVVSRCDVLRTLLPTDDAAQREAQHRLDVYADGRRRWPVTVHDATAAVDGEFDDQAEREAVVALVRTTPGVTTVQVRRPRA
ncbi:CBS domain-containing protein [Dactylosporangium sp. AC04546]|uniref:CBS domain-containing protein n=1 Tax=Dactylosporangium sp. AC04546 TaxID=2862460 RepID=UPI001EDCC943|nr:CBS domain-containing protein [Dactylosporangium sp. AC04546]WVK78545.1 CBS domain-containing protein [Dactylosporangium sp. AC04546]